MCFPCKKRLLQHSVELYDLSSTPQVRLQVENKKRVLHFGFVWVFWGPFNRSSFRTQQTLSPHPPKFSCSASSCRVNSRYLIEDTKNYVRKSWWSVSQKILPKICHHKTLSLLRKFIWELARSLMGRNSGVCSDDGLKEKECFFVCPMQNWA